MNTTESAALAFYQLIYTAATDQKLNEYEVGIYAYLLARGGSSVAAEDIVERFYIREEIENAPVSADWQRQGVAGVKNTLRKLVDVSCKKLASLGYVGGGEGGWYAK